jgi:WhiB family redox-sensing transcriptional regulator
MVIHGRNAFVESDAAMDWRDDAACVRLATAINFFPERGESAAQAKAICAMCSVRQPCLEFALQHNVSCGVWGGLSGRERRQVLRQRRMGSRRVHHHL